MKLVNIGFGNIIALERVISIVSPESAPIKRLVQEAKDSKMAIDATYGRKTRAVIIMDSGHVVLSAIQPETVASRIDKDIIDVEGFQVDDITTWKSIMISAYISTDIIIVNRNTRLDDVIKILIFFS